MLPLGIPVAVVTQVSIFKCLFTDGKDLTTASEWQRIVAAERIVPLVTTALLDTQAAYEATDLRMEMVSTARTADEKRALVVRQREEGREGEVWVRADCTYAGGKGGGETIVRTKNLVETECIITALTPSTVAGRPFAAIEVSVWEGSPEPSLVPVGLVGTCFSHEDAEQIAAAHAANPGRVKALIRSQGRTERNHLWHARFLELL